MGITAKDIIKRIKDEDIKDCPKFYEVVDEIVSWLKDSDLSGFNSSKFDLPMLAEEIERVRKYKGKDIQVNLHDMKMVDVQNIYHKLERRTLIAAYKYYCGKDLENAHSALADTRATYEVLQAQLDKYPNDLKNDVAFLSEFSRMTNNVDYAGRLIYNEKGEEIINFGKYKGRRVQDVLANDPGYYSWVQSADFSLNTKYVFTQLRLKYAMK